MHECFCKVFTQDWLIPFYCADTQTLPKLAHINKNDWLRAQAMFRQV